MSLNTATKTAIGAAFLTAATQANAGLITLDFEELPANSAVAPSITYDDGATIYSHFGAPLYALETDGNNVLRTAFASDGIHFEIEDGSAFQFHGLDVHTLSQHPDQNLEQMFFIDYVTEDGESGTYGFEAANALQEQLMIQAIAELTEHLISLHFHTNNWVAGIDNIQVDIVADDFTDGDETVDVPEPNMVATFILGLAGMTYWRRREQEPKALTV